MLAVALDWRVVRIPPKMFGTASILDLEKFLLRQKKERFVQTCVMLPIAIVWLVAFCYAIFVNPNNPFIHDNPEYAKICGVVSGIIGGIVGIIAVVVIYRKMQRTNDTLLRDIHDLENES